MKKHDFDNLVESARGTNLADFFTHSGYTTERYGAEIYVHDFPGLCVNQRTNKWFNHYEKIGGSNAVDCFVKVCGYDFKQAVYELTGRDISDNSSCDYPKKYRPQFTSPPNSAPLVTASKKTLQMPPSSESMRRVFAYLCKERKIPAEIVEELAHQKLLYQSSEEFNTTINGIPQTCKTSNAVFVHTDNNGVAIGGEVQGINSFKRYKAMVAGTGDSAFMFTPFPAKADTSGNGKIKTAYLFESAIDLMSFYAFCKKSKMQGVCLVSMAGLKASVPLQLKSQGIRIISCVDNDSEGRKFEQKHGFERSKNSMLEKASVKDWNELLVLKIANPSAVKDFVPDIERKNLFTRRAT